MRYGEMSPRPKGVRTAAEGNTFILKLARLPVKGMPRWRLLIDRIPGVHQSAEPSLCPHGYHIALECQSCWDDAFTDNPTDGVADGADFGIESAGGNVRFLRN